MDSLVNEDDEWEWYEEEDEQQQTNDDSAKNTETTNAETIFAQRRKSSCKVDTMFTFNQVQTKAGQNERRCCAHLMQEKAVSDLLLVGGFALIVNA